MGRRLYFTDDESHPRQAAERMVESGGCWVAVGPPHLPTATKQRMRSLVLSPCTRRCRMFPRPGNRRGTSSYCSPTGRIEGRGLGTLLLAKARELTLAAEVNVLRVDCYAGGDGKLVRWYESQGL